MKEVDFDIIVPKDEPVVTPLEAEVTEGDMPTLEADADELGNARDALGMEAAADEDENRANAKRKKNGRSQEKRLSESRPQTWRQWIIDDDIKFDKQMLLELLNGISLVGFLKRNWLFVLSLMVFLMIYVSLGYHHRNLMIENDKLNRELLDRRYKALTRSSELRERTLGSKIEGQLQDSTIQTSTDAPFELPVSSEE